MKLLIIILFTAASFSFSQETGRIRGFVTDSTNGESLPFCNVVIDELKTGASTNDRGIFYLNSVPVGKKYNLTISYIGYKTKSVEVEVIKNQLTDISIQLFPLSIELQTVEKIGEKIVQKNKTDIGVEQISIKQLEYLPKGIETDVMRSLQNIAGVRSTGDVSARYYVRGGTSDQNLVLLNGVTIYNPFHSLGLFSVIDPDMINSMEFYKGGYSSEFGGRLSSVLNVVSKDGNKKRYSALAAVSLLTAKGLVEGPIPNGSFIFTGRKSYSTDVLKKFLNDETVPIDFYDASFKLNYSSSDIFNNAKFVVFGFLSSDKIKYDDPLREEYSWKNNLFGFEWLQVYDVPIFSRLGISLSNFEGVIIPNASALKSRNNQLKDFSINYDLNIITASKDEMAFGLNIKLLDSKLFLENKYGVESDLNKFAGNFSFYGKYKFLRFEDFGADIGSRFIITGLNSETSSVPEPRVSFTYRLLPVLALKGAWGIYYQELTAITDESEVISLFEPWIIIPDNMQSASSINYSGGIEYNLSPEFTFTTEAYYRIIHNLPIINDKKYKTTDPDLVSGKGESYGFEFTSKYSDRALNVTASYTLSWAYKEVNNYLYYPKYDTRNAVNFSMDYNFGGGWIASSTWTYYSGLPFTQITGIYDKFYFNNLLDPYGQNGQFQPYQILGDKNIERLPQYHRLDLGITKRTEFNFMNIELGLNIINVYNRENIFYYQRDSGKRVNMLPFLISGTVKIEI